MNGQLDYIFFVYGFAFLLLAAMLWGRAQSAGERLPWSWLAWFALLHGLNEWLDMLAISLGDSPAFKAVRLVVLAASFTPLVEFGRRGLKAQGVPMPGPWVLAPLLMLAGIGGLAGISGLNVACRYALGLPGGLSAGWVLLREPGPLNSRKRRSHRFAGLAFLVYGFATGLVVTKVDFFPASVLNQEAFMAACGFPVQLIRALCAAIAAVGFWLADRQEQETEYETVLFRRWVLPGMVLSLLAGGFWAANWRGQIVDSEQRDRLLHQATAVSRTVRAEWVHFLSFTEADKANPVFQRIRSQMTAFAQVVHIRSLYSMTIRDGKILFGPESLAENDPFASPPGTIYQKPPVELHAVFRSRLPQTCGPYTDEYGSFVSAFAPVTDPRTGEVALVIGVDVESDAWREAVGSERFHAILFTLTMVMICLVGRVLLERRRRVAQKSWDWQSHVETLVTALVGLAFTLGLVHVVLEDEGRTRRTMFMRMADSSANRFVQMMLNVQDNIPLSIAPLLEAEQVLSPNVFRALASQRVNLYGVAEPGWLPRMAAGDRVKLEELAKQGWFEDVGLDGQGMAGDGKPAEPREVYFPLFFVDPQNVHKSILNFDIAGNPERWTAAQEAIRSGLPTATDVVETVTNPRQKAIIVYMPVFKKISAALYGPAKGVHTDLLGLVSVTLRLDTLLTKTFSESPRESTFAAMSLFQSRIQMPPQPLSVYQEGSTFIDNFVPLQNTEAYDIVPLFAFGKAYAIVSYPGQTFLPDQTLRSGWAAGLAGLLLTAALTALTGSLARHGADLEKQVRKRTAELVASRESYRRQFSDNLTVMLLIDPSTGGIIDANTAAAAFYGYSREQMMSMRIMDIDTPSREVIQTAMTASAAEHGHTLELQHRLTTGSVRDVEVSYSRVRFGGQEVLHAIVHDISERKRAERIMTARAKLAELAPRCSLDELLKTTLDETENLTGSRISFYHFLEADQVTLSLQNWSIRTLGEFCTAAGKGSHYEIAKAGVWVDCLHARRPVIHNDYASLPHRKGLPEGHAEVKRELVVPIMRGERITAILGVGNKLLDYDEQDVETVSRIADLSWDLVEHKLAEEAVRKSELEKSIILDNANEIIAFHDKDHRIVWANSVYFNEVSAITGFAVTIANLKGKKCFEAWGVEKVCNDCPVSRAIQTGKPHEGELSPQNQEHWPATHGSWAVRAAPVKDSSGSIVGAIQIAHNITERKRAEDEKEKLQAQLSQAQKMESVGRLAGGVAHDFNNMLGVILGYTDLALSKTDPSDPLASYLQQIHKAAEHSADLTGQLLAFARRQTISPRVLNLNETVEGTLKIIRRLIGEDIDLAWLPGRELWPVKVDPGQIDQVLANLCVNARDAIAGVGKVTIETDNAVFDEAFCRGHAGFVPGEYVLLAVSDDGCGMDQEVLNNVFEPFFTTKEVGKGTGLGLSTVYGIVRQNSGFINVYSEPGHGTTFKLYFPRTDLPVSEERPSEREEKDLRGTETVLLVEDEESILALGKTILERYGYGVLTARSPAEALSLAERYHGPIHLLVTDVVMPGMNGRDLNEKLCASKPGLKCIFMSGYTANVVAHHGILDEGVHFLQKPFSVKALAAKVREALEE